MPLMYYWYIYSIVTILLLGGMSYMIGRENSPEINHGDIIAHVFFFGLIAMLWPIVLSIGIAVAPFFGPYYLGKRHRRIKTEKEKMWNTLKG